MLAAPSLLPIGWRVSSVSAAPLLFDVGGNTLCQMQYRVIDEERGRPTVLLRPCGRMDSEQRQGKDAGCEGHDELVHDILRQTRQPDVVNASPHKSPGPRNGREHSEQLSFIISAKNVAAAVSVPQLCLATRGFVLRTRADTEATRGSRQGKTRRVHFDRPGKAGGCRGRPRSRSIADCRSIICTRRRAK
jgi:hypothetical protein